MSRSTPVHTKGNNRDMKETNWAIFVHFEMSMSSITRVSSRFGNLHVRELCKFPNLVPSKSISAVLMPTVVSAHGLTKPTVKAPPALPSRPLPFTAPNHSRRRLCRQAAPPVSRSWLGESYTGSLQTPLAATVFLSASDNRVSFSDVSSITFC